MIQPGDGIDRYLRAILDLQQRVIAEQHSILVQVAEEMAQTIEADRRIFIFGTGHSHLLVEEGFFRAGGLAAVVPIFSSALMLHENLGLGSRLERTSGLAEEILRPYEMKPREMLFIYSNSGINIMPLEITALAKNQGLIIVGIASEKYSLASVAHSGWGKRLADVVDYFLDNGGEPGDALVPINGADWKVGPSSTIMGALIWNSLLTETVYRLQERGIQAPVIASINMPGAEEHNRVILEKWRKVNPHL